MKKIAAVGLAGTVLVVLAPAAAAESGVDATSLASFGMKSFRSTACVVGPGDLRGVDESHFGFRNAGVAQR
ncbi:hypothetical protein [Streptodolium elevatio]|uniref:Uncharacterized protein n=1 Tax=Streptodolium elevatio TaxID=3157996 RepID=A0ABV3DPD8_9ACTN